MARSIIGSEIRPPIDNACAVKREPCLRTDAASVRKIKIERDTTAIDRCFTYFDIDARTSNSLYLAIHCMFLVESQLNSLRMVGHNHESRRCNKDVKRR